MATAASDAAELSLYWNPNVGSKHAADHWLTFGSDQAANATAQGYTLLRQIGYAPAAGSKAAKKPVYGTFRLNFHHFDRFELDLRGHTHVRGAALSCLRLKWADMVLI